jgi:hypothetical protein
MRLILVFRRAVPLSIVGAICSYYRRRNANILVKFCIAIVMLVTLRAFLVGFWATTMIEGLIWLNW